MGERERGRRQPRSPQRSRTAAPTAAVLPDGSPDRRSAPGRQPRPPQCSRTAAPIAPTLPDGSPDRPNAPVRTEGLPSIHGLQAPASRSVLSRTRPSTARRRPPPRSVLSRTRPSTARRRPPPRSPHDPEHERSESTERSGVDQKPETNPTSYRSRDKASSLDPPHGAAVGRPRITT